MTEKVNLFSINNDKLKLLYKKLTTRKLLVITLEEFAARGVLLERSITNETGILSFAETTFDISGRSIRVKIAKLIEALGDNDAREVLIVCEEVRFFPVWLPDIPRKRFSNYGMLIKSAAKAEIASFFNEQVDKLFVSAVWAARDDESDDDLHSISEQKKREALVFATSQSVFDGLQGILNGFKKKLVGVVSPEIFAWGICGKTVANSGNFIIIDWKQYEIMFTLIKNGLPLQIQSAAIEAGENGLDLIKKVAAESSEGIENIGEIVVGGEMVEKTPWTTENASYNHTILKKWDIGDELPSIKCLSGIPPRYMTALGAAANFMAPKDERAVCVNNIPFTRKIKDNVHIIPLLLFIIFLTSIGIEYALLKSKNGKLDIKIKELKAEETSLSSRMKSKEDLENEYSRKKNQKLELKTNRTLLLQDIPATMRGTCLFLNGLSVKTPENVQLHSVEQFSDELFFIEGKSKEIQSVQLFPVRLKEIEGIAEVKMEKSTERMTTVEGSSRPERWYHFRVRVRVMLEAK